MAYSSKQIQRIAEELGDAYRNGELRILRILAGKTTEWNRAFQLQQLKQVQAVLATLDETATKWGQAYLPELYKAGKQAIREKLGLGESTFTRLDVESVQLVGENLVTRLGNATTTVGRQVQDVFREVGLKSLRQQLITGGTVVDVRKEMLGHFQQKGITAFVDKSGREWNLPDYANMVARTTSRECANEGAKNGMVEAGYDLVEVSSSPEACELCQEWEGEILSITGETEGYDTVDDAEAEGLFHPNCTHVLLPYTEGGRTLAGDE